MATLKEAYGTYDPLTVTNLNSLANDASDPYTAWQSERISNLTDLAVDYEIRVHLPTAATAPANDQAAYVYIVPWMYDGSAWAAGGNFGTTTLPSGSEGTASISDPNSMAGPIVLPYKVTSQVLNAQFFLSRFFSSMPDGWSLAIRNATGAALSTGCVVEQRPITKTIA